MPEAKDYKNLIFTDRAIAILPWQVRDLAIIKFKELGLSDSDFNPHHTAVCDAEEQEETFKGVRYYHIQIESGMADEIMAAAADGRFGHYMGSRSVYGYCEIRPEQKRPNFGSPKPG